MKTPEDIKRSLSSEIVEIQNKISNYISKNARLIATRNHIKVEVYRFEQFLDLSDLQQELLPLACKDAVKFGWDIKFLRANAHGEETVVISAIKPTES